MHFYFIMVVHTYLVLVIPIGIKFSDFSSISAYMFILAGAPVSWKLKKQRTIATSSTEAEYYACQRVSKNAYFLLMYLSIPTFPLICLLILPRIMLPVLHLLKILLSILIPNIFWCATILFASLFNKISFIYNRCLLKISLLIYLLKVTKDPNHFQTLLIESGLHFPSSP